MDHLFGVRKFGVFKRETNMGSINIHKKHGSIQETCSGRYKDGGESNRKPPNFERNDTANLTFEKTILRLQTWLESFDGDHLPRKVKIMKQGRVTSALACKVPCTFPSQERLSIRLFSGFVRSLLGFASQSLLPEFPQHS